MSYTLRFKHWILRTGKEFAVTGSIIGGSFVGFLAFDTNVAAIRKVEGPSMSPTLNENEYTEDKFADRDPLNPIRDPDIYNDLVWFSRKFELQRGDVVYVADPKRQNTSLVKRVIGLPGDTIVPLGFNQEKKDPVILSKNQVWIESDSGGFKYRDSNQFGPVHIKTIQGKGSYVLNIFKFRFRTLESKVPESSLNRLNISDS